MAHIVRRFAAVVATAILVVFFAVDPTARQLILGSPPVAHAGDITSPSWSLSSTSVGATNVTYTHTFTIATAIPANTGQIQINTTLPPNPSSTAIPDFSHASLTSGSTSGLAGLPFQFFPNGCCEMLMVIQNGATTIPAGTVTLEFSGVTNPSVGGSFGTNTYTMNNGTLLDGNQGPDATAAITVGTIALTVHLTDADNSNGAIANFPLELHPQTFGDMWRVSTDSNGDAKFYGVPNGTYVLEESHGVDPSSAAAVLVSKYSVFNPQTISVPTGGPVNISMHRSTKTIVATVTDSSGQPVQNAMVNSFSQGGSGGFAFAQTDSQGKATLHVSVDSTNSTLMLMAMPQQGGPGQPPVSSFVPAPPSPVSFNLAPDAQETVTVNITVQKPDATIVGKIVNPDGTPAMTGGLGATNFRTHQSQPIMLANDGSFTFPALSSSGEWQLQRFDQGGDYSLPEVRFTVKAGTNNLGTIKLVPFDGAVTVKAVRVDSGSPNPMPNVPVAVFDTKEFAPPIMGFTDASGVATVKVFKGGDYRVMAMPGSGGGPAKPEGKRLSLLEELHIIDSAYAQSAGSVGSLDGSRLFPITPPQMAKSGDTVTLKFDKANEKVTVTVKDTTGNLVTDDGYVNARPNGNKTAMYGGGFGAPSAGGSATVYTTTGDYIFNIFFPPDSQFAGQDTKATVSGDANITLTAIKKTVSITGHIKDSNGNVLSGATVKNLNLMIGGFWNGGMSAGSVNPDAGTYSLMVPYGVDVHVGVAPAAALMGGTSDYVPSMSPTTVKGVDGEAITKDLTLTKVDATINVTVKDQNGKAIQGVTVFADNHLAEIVGNGGPDGGPGGPPEVSGPEFGFSGVTDSNGAATIKVSPNTYNLAVNARAQGLFNTSVNQVVIKSQETKNVTVTLAKPDATLIVPVKKSDGTLVDGATINLFNTDGTIAFSATDGSSDDADGKVDGQVKIAVPSGSYTVRSGLDNTQTGEVQESSLGQVSVPKGSTTTFDSSVTAQDNALAAPVTQSVSGSSPSTISLTRTGQSSPDVTLNISTGALTSSVGGNGGSGSSDTTISLVPTQAEATATKSDLPVRGVKITAMDSSGNPVTTVSSPISGTIAYDASDIPAGMTEDQFISNASVKSFDDNSGQWSQVAASSCDKTTRTCTFSTTHLTDFAIVASADTTAPSAPTNVSAAATTNNGEVKLSWTNSTASDLKGVNVYRSTSSGTLGDKVYSSVTGTSKTDTGLTNGTTYYYTLRSIDTAGNESSNTDQHSAVPGSNTLPKTGANLPTSSHVSGLTLVLLAGLAVIYGAARRLRHG